MHRGFDSLGSCSSVSWSSNGVALTTAYAEIDLEALSPGVIRVRMLRRGEGNLRLPPSFTVVEHSWPTPAVTCEERTHCIRLSTSQITVEVQKHPLRVSFIRPDGTAVAADSPAHGMGWTEHGVGCYKESAPGTHFYGFGQRTGFLDKQRTAMTLWNSDVNPHTPGTDSLYVSIPFFIAFSGQSAYGIYMDTAARSTFNMGRPKFMPWASEIDLCPLPYPEVDAGEYWFGTEGKRLDYYFFAGPEISDVVHAYSDLTGRMELPPLWALGYHQCRFSYCPESQVREVARAMREADIPCDAIYLDIDYMDGFRVFTFDPKHFPDPGRLISDLREDGFKVVTIVDPGVKVDARYPVYRQGRRKHVFIRRPDGKVYKGRVWPGVVAYPDFARPTSRTWWAHNHKALFDAGVRGIWNDMNEPSNFATDTGTLDEVALHGDPGAEVEHAYVHNAYGNLMSQATREAFTQLLPNTRPFIITRAGCGGIQRHASVWTGDNSSWWEHLLMAIPMCCNMSLSGVSFVGADVGGFMDNADPELVTRWTQFGAFVPLFRSHSMIRSVPQEPYALGEPYTSICRKYIKLRYRLLPYMYTLLRQCAQDGTPIMRPMVYDFPGDPATHTMYDQFMLGSRVMVAPVYLPGAVARPVYFPRGRWADLQTGQIVESQGEHVLVQCPLGQIPAYLKEGSILPWGREMSYVGQREQALEVIDIFPSPGASGHIFSVYVDDGETLDYKDGKFGFVDISYSAREPGRLILTITSRNGHHPCIMDIGVVRILGVSARPKRVLLNGVPLSRVASADELDRQGFLCDPETGRVTLGLHTPSKHVSVDVCF
ncbi:MAG TPA: glycoside hydrolase family 31 protein [Bacillota bacterium]|nr:glycoside hydrolase family 31 protein [Bacillota bacterium]